MEDQKELPYQQFSSPYQEKLYQLITTAISDESGSHYGPRSGLPRDQLILYYIKNSRSDLGIFWEDRDALLSSSEMRNLRDIVEGSDNYDLLKNGQELYEQLEREARAQTRREQHTDPHHRSGGSRVEHHYHGSSSADTFIMGYLAGGMGGHHHHGGGGGCGGCGDCDDCKGDDCGGLAIIFIVIVLIILATIAIITIALALNELESARQDARDGTSNKFWVIAFTGLAAITACIFVTLKTSAITSASASLSGSLMAHASGHLSAAAAVGLAGTILTMSAMLGVGIAILLVAGLYSHFSKAYKYDESDRLGEGVTEKHINQLSKAIDNTGTSFCCAHITNSIFASQAHENKRKAKNLVSYLKKGGDYRKAEQHLEAKGDYRLLKAFKAGKLEPPSAQPGDYSTTDRHTTKSDYRKLPPSAPAWEDAGEQRLGGGYTHDIHTI